MSALADAAGAVTDGARVGIGGVLDRHRPLAACGAVAAAGRRDLRVWSFLAGFSERLVPSILKSTETTLGQVSTRSRTAG